MPRTRTIPPRPMIAEGNAHIGRDVWSFSLPAFATCPGATADCLSACYALGNLFRLENVRAMHHANWERALGDPAAFARHMVDEIRGKYVRTLRIHVAGDFFSEPYIRAWDRVARSCRSVTFLAYTRSWRVPDLAPALVGLGSLPNVYLWWSEDRASGPCRLPGGRRCFLCVEPGDEVFVPDDVDLVFRDDTRRPLKWARSAWVCPKEQGVPHGLTCSTCRRCFVPGPMPRRPVG